MHCARRERKDRSSGDIVRRLKALGDPGDAARLSRFFKTGRGEYAEGDRFLGIRVPVLRRHAREWEDLPLAEIEALLTEPFHEARRLALLLLAGRYAQSGAAGRTLIYRLYLRRTKHIDNWDLVDCSAEAIVGAHLFQRDRKPIYRLARSPSLWERRIAIVSTLYFIRRHDVGDTLALAGRLLDDREDLIHKATGWMLREVGKRSPEAEKRFLVEHHRRMPRTMLRYAIERWPESERVAYLRGAR